LRRDVRTSRGICIRAIVLRLRMCSCVDSRETCRG
jgi:hypothetical protein